MSAAMTGRHVIIDTETPAAVTLGTMGRVAREAASTWTLREWAGVLAARAAPRDYVGQLRQLYGGILERWRYVQEPEEWVHGTARSMLGTVLGLRYNGASDPTRADVSRTPSTRKGWGDCDDVATLTAAGVLALGMRPAFRVVRGDSGGHVAVIARTPDGRVVSLDPVGHPKHPFGWALEGPIVEIYDLAGQRADHAPFGGITPMSCRCSAAPSSRLAGVPDVDPYRVANGETYLSTYDGRPVARLRGRHYAAVPLGDVDGARCLAVPAKAAALMSRGVVLDGTPAVDDLGHSYRYDAGRDIWVADRLHGTRLATLAGVDGGLSGFADRMKDRWRRRIAVARRVVGRVVRVVRGVAARVLQSRAAQIVVGNALRAIGVPAKLTKGVMAAAGSILRQGGLVGLVRLLRSNPRAAAQLVARAAKEGVRAGMRLAGEPADSGPSYHLVTQSGRHFVGQPIEAISAVPGWYELGDIEIQPTPTPGSWYRIRKGDSLLAVAGKAYGLKSGSERLARARWINESNPKLVDPQENRSKMFPGGTVSFLPRFSADADAASRGEPGKSYGVIYVPLAKGDRPAERVPEPGPAQAAELPELPLPPPMPTTAADTPPLPPAMPAGPAQVEIRPLPPSEPVAPVECPPGLVRSASGGCVYPAPSQGPALPRPVEVEPVLAPEPAAPPPVPVPECPPGLIRSASGGCVYPSPAQGPALPRPVEVEPVLAPEPPVLEPAAPPPVLEPAAPPPVLEPVPAAEPECPPGLVRAASGGCVYPSPSQGPALPRDPKALLGWLAFLMMTGDI
jgi:hypothetical protein